MEMDYNLKLLLLSLVVVYSVFEESFDIFLSVLQEHFLYSSKVT